MQGPQQEWQEGEVVVTLGWQGAGTVVCPVSSAKCGARDCIYMVTSNHGTQYSHSWRPSSWWRGPPPPLSSPESHRYHQPAPLDPTLLCFRVLLNSCAASCSLLAPASTATFTASLAEVDSLSRQGTPVRGTGSGVIIIIIIAIITRYLFIVIIIITWTQSEQGAGEKVRYTGQLARLVGLGGEEGHQHALCQAK